MHGDDVRVAFHQVAAVLLDDGLLGLVHAVEFVALVVDFRFGRVDVLHLHTLGSGGQYASAEGYHLAAKRVDGKDDASPETVAQAVVVRLVAEAGLHQVFLLVTLAECLAGHGVVALGAVAQLELLDDVVAEAAAPEVGHADVASFLGLPQGAAEVVVGPLVDHEQALALALCGLFFARQFAFLDFDAVFLGQEAQGLGIGELFVLHDEMDSVAPFAAGEAFAEPLGGRDVERGRLVVVEGTEAHVVDAALAQGHEVRHDVVNLRRVHNPVYGGLVYHCGGQSYGLFSDNVSLGEHKVALYVRRPALCIPI